MFRASTLVTLLTAACALAAPQLVQRAAKITGNIISLRLVTLLDSLSLQIPRSSSTLSPSRTSRTPSTTTASTSLTSRPSPPLDTNPGSAPASSRSRTTRQHTSSSYPRPLELTPSSLAHTTCEQFALQRRRKNLTFCLFPARTTTPSRLQPCPWHSRPSARRRTLVLPSSSRIRLL